MHTAQGRAKRRRAGRGGRPHPAAGPANKPACACELTTPAPPCAPPSRQTGVCVPADNAAGACPGKPLRLLLCWVDPHEANREGSAADLGDDVSFVPLYAVFVILCIRLYVTFANNTELGWVAPRPAVKPSCACLR